METTHTIDATGQIVKDIIDLKIEAGNIPSNATLGGLFRWYAWAFNHRIVEVAYKYGKLQGYMEWIRLDEIPKNREDIIDKIDYSSIGPILYITTCCVRDDQSRHGVLWKLIHMVREKNKNFDYVCWHENVLDKVELKVYRNSKEGGSND